MIGNNWNGNGTSVDNSYQHHQLHTTSLHSYIDYGYSGQMINRTQSEMNRHDLERRQRMEKMMEAEKAIHRLIKQEEEEIYYLLT